jgi:hypothetical protein
MLEVDRVNRKKFQAEELEFALFSSLNPVDPDPEFVTRLRNRFDHMPSTVIEHRTFWEAYVIIATGLFFGTFLIWLVQRLVSRREPASG